ncbi:MAG: hypothetical protein SCH66_09610 [Methanolobus sp.]|nr:hypothetical protein [Methanolobus sp.]
MRYGLLAAILIIAVLGSAALLLGSGNNNFLTGSGSGALSNSEGPVTVSLRYLGETSNREYADFMAFSVSMDTHSVNLDEYNMEDLSYLRNSNNEKYLPSKWIEDDGSGGHHRSGVLLFPKYDESGDSILDPGDSYFEIVVNEVGGVAERTFRLGL